MCSMKRYRRYTHSSSRREQRQSLWVDERGWAVSYLSLFALRIQIYPFLQKRLLVREGSVFGLFHRDQSIRPWNSPDGRAVDGEVSGPLGRREEMLRSFLSGLQGVLRVKSEMVFLNALLSSFSGCLSMEVVCDVRYADGVDWSGGLMDRFHD